MSKINVIYYVTDPDQSYGEINNICANQKINLDYEIDFSRLVSHVVTSSPSMLILNLVDYKNGVKYLSTFEAGSMFEVPIVMVLGNITPDFPLNLPSNYIYCKIADFSENLRKIVANLEKMHENDANFDINITNYDVILHKIFNCLGFNMGTRGRRYLEYCITEILLNRCIPNIAVKKYYLKLAIRNNTTVSNVARCIQAVINTAWKRYKNHKTRAINGITFDDFAACPKAKEFMYYVANKIHDDSHHKKFKVKPC